MQSVSSEFSVEDGHGRFDVEEEEEVDLWKLGVWLEELFTVRLVHFRYQDTTSEGSGS
jgi:hypothetical protein